MMRYSIILGSEGGIQDTISSSALEEVTEIEDGGGIYKGVVVVAKLEKFN